ncbi:5717_t:CDS:2, partial [Racocetra fulgida]
AIMKKFEELDRIREEMGITKHTESNSEVDSPIKQSNLQETEGLTQEQLEEVFKRTSSFTVKSATFAPNLDEVDDLDFWRIEMEDGNTAEYEEEDEYMTVDNDFWDEEFGERKRRKSDKSGSSRRSGLDRETLLQRYKIMQVRLQDRNGLPTYMRIPPLPIPRSWALTISPPSVEFVTPVIAIYIDPPLLLPGEAPSPGKISVQQFKEFIPDIVQIAEKWRFRYDGDIELRHQRNPDCVFDFIKPRAPVMYEIIETLLPQAVFSEQNNKGDKLLEL